MDFLQPRMFHMRIDLRGLDACMAQHFLDQPQVGSAGQQVRGKTVPQRVGADLWIDSRATDIAFHEPPELDPIERLTAAAEKDFVRGLAVRRKERRTKLVQVAVERFESPASEGHDSLFPPLPLAAHLPLFEIEIPQPQIADFARATSGCVEDLQKSHIALPESIGFSRRVEERFDLLDREDLWDPFPHPLGDDQIRRILLDDSLELEVFHERPHGDHISRHAGRGKGLVMEKADVMRELLDVQLVDAFALGPLHESPQVIAISENRVLG